MTPFLFQACQATPGCNWYTYYPGNEFCLYFSDCTISTGSCAECTSGESDCPYSPGGTDDCEEEGQCSGNMLTAYTNILDKEECYDVSIQILNANPKVRTICLCTAL